MKLLLIGWDTADWSIIHELLERGFMPRLQHFLSGGISGELQPVRPFDSAALWTSIVTGKRATSHGVLSTVEADPSRIRIRPTSRWALKARPIWSILSQAGYRTHVLGWPASHPAEPVNGVAISDQFAEFGASDSVHPPRLLDTLHPLRLSATEIDAASLVTLLPRAAELNPAADQRLYVVAQFLALTASVHAAATWVLEHEPWDFAAVRYAGLARLAGVFGSAYAAAQSGEQNGDAALFGDLIPNAYRFFDMLLGRLLELAGSEASVMLVSQQGWALSSPSAKPSTSRPKPGILIAAGPAFRSHRQLTAASVCDVTPTILHLFGLPTEPGSHGRAWCDMLSKAACDAAASTAAVGRPSGEIVDRTDERPEVRNDEPPSQPADDAAVAHLLSLGYRDRPDEFLRFAIAQLDQQRQWRLAEAWIDNGQYDRAARVLEGLVQTEPTSIAYRSALAEAYFRAGEHESCRQLILALQAEGADSPLAHVGLAALALESRDNAAAVEHLQQAEAMSGLSANVLELMGRLYLQLRRTAEADLAFDAAAALDPTLATAHDGRAIACLFAGDPFGAERHASEAVKLNPLSYEARYHLGLALARQNRVDEAIDVLRAAIALDRRFGAASAHRHLADLLHRRGDHAMAMHHRELCRREASSMSME